MNSFKHSSLLPFIFVSLTLLSCASSATIHQKFFQCLSGISSDNGGIFRVIFTPLNLSYTSILESRIQNLLFNATDTPKPLAIVTPLNVSHVQDTVICASKYNLQIRIRSGGHDFEGLSYVSPLPFVMLDLINLRNIDVDVRNRVAWVESGATLGELYYRIAEKSRTLAFPAGTCSTVGVGGHISGGGYGFLLRKYGLAADNIVDALLVDANGRVLDRASMGEDLFWAIRGGGGNSFGVVISWKINLVPVPPTVTVFGLIRSLEQNTTKLLNRWQYANELPHEISLEILVSNVNSTKSAQFTSFYLGGIDSLLTIMEERFPELGLKREDCSEMSWIEAQVYFAGFPSNSSLDILLNRTNTALTSYKIKSDYVKEHIPEAAIEGLINWLSNEKIKSSMYFLMVPYGGIMDEIAETSIPFPHRAGNLYMIAYGISWDEEDIKTALKSINWIRKIYADMKPYVSKSPRGAYLNYRDLDIGTNNIWGNTSYQRASIWGSKYFKNNFDKLVEVKTRVDPSNFLRNEQSIPPLSHW